MARKRSTRPMFHSVSSLPPDNDYERNRRDRLFDVAPDGRFVMIERAGVFGRTGDLVIVQNFFEDLKAKVGN